MKRHGDNLREVFDRLTPPAAPGSLEDAAGRVLRRLREGRNHETIKEQPSESRHRIGLRFAVAAVLILTVAIGVYAFRVQRASRSRVVPHVTERPALSVKTSAESTRTAALASGSTKPVVPPPGEEIAAGVAAQVAAAQSTDAGAARLQFEVISIRENTDNGSSDMNRPRRSGELLFMHNTRIFSMVNYAYKLTATYQIDGYDKYPEQWKWYDVEAKAPRDATDDQVRLMFQALLEDRFKFKVHREKRDLPLYEVVSDKGKTKLRPSTNQPMEVTVEGRKIVQAPGTCSSTLWREGVHWVCHAAGMDKIVASISGEKRFPVVDHTEISGTFDFDVRYIPEDRRLDADVPPGPSFDQALQEELGLKLKKAKGSVEVIVIDHLEKPSEN
jgi:uncharacterized protein (TIGR03435 family)